MTCLMPVPDDLNFPATRCAPPKRFQRSALNGALLLALSMASLQASATITITVVCANLDPSLNPVPYDSQALGCYILDRPIPSGSADAIRCDNYKEEVDGPVIGKKCDWNTGGSLTFFATGSYQSTGLSCAAAQPGDFYLPESDANYGGYIGYGGVICSGEALEDSPAPIPDAPKKPEEDVQAGDPGTGDTGNADSPVAALPSTPANGNGDKNSCDSSSPGSSYRQPSSGSSYQESGYYFSGYDNAPGAPQPSHTDSSNRQLSASAESVFDPIYPGSGNSLQSQTLYIGSGPFPLAHQLVYNSLSFNSAFQTTQKVGERWRSNYDRTVNLATDGLSARVYRADGKSYLFNKQADDTWQPAPNILGKLVRTASGWRYTTLGQMVETYSSSGQLLSLADRNGVTQTLAYDAGGRLSSVSHSLGRKLTFAYDSSGRVASLVNPSGQTTLLAYDAVGNLNKITWPDASSKQYLYENTTFTHAMTGVVDETGNRYASWTYDAQGRATSNTLGNNLSTGQISYGADTVTITSELGATSTRRYSMVNGQPLTTDLQNSTPGSSASAVQRSFDANGYVASETLNGLTTTYVRDAQGRELSSTVAAGTPQALTTTTTWHPVFRVPTRIVYAASGTERTAAYQYDSRGSLLETTVSGTGQTSSTRYQYNPAGQITQITGPKGETSRYSYDSQGNLTGSTNPLGQTSRITSLDAEGRPLTLIDANGLTTRLQYDARGRLISQTVGDLVTRYTWLAWGGLNTETRPDASTATYRYDSAHRLTEIQDSRGSRTLFSLNALGQATQIDTYDADGVRRQTQAASYDSLGRLVQSSGAQGQATRWSYDAQHRPITRTDPLGRIERTDYDALGRVTTLTAPDQSQTRYSYDPLGQLTQVTDPRGLATQYRYDGLGRVTQQISPDTGSSSTQYDVAGLPISSTDARGKTTQYSFDSAYRLRSVRDASGQQTEWIYDQGTGGIGRLYQIRNPASLITYQRDSLGRILTRAETIAGQTLNTRYRYDSAGRLQQITYPSGRQISYSYGAQGRVSQLLVDGKPLVTDLKYLPTGQLSSGRFANGQTLTRQYDLDGRLTAHPLGNLTYDAADRITAYSPSALNAFAGQSSYQYDSLDRLIRLQYDNAPLLYSYDLNGNRLKETTGSAEAAYQIAAGSNRLTAVQVKGAATGGKDREDDKDRDGKDGRTEKGKESNDDHDDKDKGDKGKDDNDQGGKDDKDDRPRTVGYAFTYDASGNMTQRADLRLSYDAAGRLVAAGDTRYAYNGLGYRVSKLGDGKGRNEDNDDNRLFAYDDGATLLGEYSLKGKPIAETVYLNGAPILALWNQKVGFIHSDHLGTPRLISDDKARPLWAWNTLAFGATLPVEKFKGSDGFNYNLRFPGQYYDAETGLHYNIHRYYDPQTGRYTTSDPIGLAGGINTYAYVNGNPVNWVDPLGLLGCRGNPAAHKPGTCGSGSNESLVPDNPLGYPFSNACKAHDACYDDPNSTSKAACDQEFKNSMKQECAKFPRGQGAVCEALADTYFNAVDKFGGSAYDDARKK